jgi:hypothetical protein
MSGGTVLSVCLFMCRLQLEERVVDERAMERVCRRGKASQTPAGLLKEANLPRE